MKRQMMIRRANLLALALVALAWTTPALAQVSGSLLVTIDDVTAVATGMQSSPSFYLELKVQPPASQPGTVSPSGWPASWTAPPGTVSDLRLVVNNAALVGEQETLRACVRQAEVAQHRADQYRFVVFVTLTDSNQFFFNGTAVSLYLGYGRFQCKLERVG